MPSLKRYRKKYAFGVRVHFGLLNFPFVLLSYIIAIILYVSRRSRTSPDEFRKSFRLFSLLFGTQRNCTRHVLHFRQCENKQGFEKRFDARCSSISVTIDKWNAKFLRVETLKHFHSDTSDRINRIPSRYLGIKILILGECENRNARISYLF